jgi:hypothetical protein
MLCEVDTRWTGVGSGGRAAGSAGPEGEIAFSDELVASRMPSGVRSARVRECAAYGFAVTVNHPPSLRPRTAGLYISSAYAGGLTKLPAVVARAT